MSASQTTYCPRCGRPMEEAEVGGRTRQVCTACGFILYRNPVPGVGVLIEQAGGIVLVQRGQPPFVGMWALPAGYIEEDESAEQAAVREAREETGLDVELADLFGVYSFPEGPVQSGIIIFYRARPAGGELAAGDDAQDVRVFLPGALPDEVAFRTHREVLAHWVKTATRDSVAEAAGVLIREAGHQDEARLLELLLLIPANAGFSPAEVQAAAQRFHENPGLEVVVAELDGEVVGFLALSYAATLAGLRVLINDMAVDPAYRRQGIGAALLEAAMQRADRRGATYLLVDTSRGNAATREFYAACGFETGGVAPLRIR